MQQHVLISARSTIQIKMDIEFFSIGVSGVVVPGGRGLRGLEVHPVHDPVCEHHAGSSGCSHKRSGVKRMIVKLRIILFSCFCHWGGKINHGENDFLGMFSPSGLNAE